MFKKIVFPLLVACIFSSSLNASTFIQPNLFDNVVVSDLDRDPAQILIERFEEWITLTQDQKDRINALADTYNWAVFTPLQRRQRAKDFRQRVYNEILTPEQKIALKAK